MAEQEEGHAMIELKDWTIRDLTDLDEGFDSFRRRHTSLTLYKRLLAPPPSEVQQTANSDLSETNGAALADLADRILAETTPTVGFLERLAPFTDGSRGHTVLREALRSDLVTGPAKPAAEAVIDLFGPSVFSSDQIRNVGSVFAANDDQLRSDQDTLRRGLRPESAANLRAARIGRDAEFTGGIAAMAGGGALVVAAAAAVAAPVVIAGGAAFLGGALIGFGAACVFDAVWGDRD
jgi:hypothetical protein